ncbi:unnamed protein product [Ectocarpus sp. CCAP 1310/34]|nr:unnamed protein product [Ectocarpus sp. CCAP 1310/34]
MFPPSPHFQILAIVATTYSISVWKLEVLDRCAVYVDNVAVGAVCCRIEPSKSPGGHDSLYIMTLGVLATWRRRNIGTHLLRRVLESLPRHPSVKEVYLHVQTNNDEAVGFYKVKWQEMCVSGVLD